MKRLLGACCVLALLTSVAFAQEKGRPQRGPGGFGAGFGGPGGFGNSPTLLLSMEAVRTELKLSEDQSGKIRDIATKAREEATANFGGLRELPEEERNKRIEEMRKKAEESNKATLAQIAKILDEKQNERFGQLRLQRDGVNALTQEEVAKKLGLSQEQKDKIAKLQADARQAGGRGGFGQNLSDEERRAAFEKAREAREKTNTDILAVLNADQKSSWDKMLGAKFEFPAGGGFGGGRPGGAAPTRRPDAKKNN